MSEPQQPMSNDSCTPVELPPPPRLITPRARRRSWTEPRVRLWWVCALVLLGIGTYFSIDEILRWNNEASLIRSGQVVRATVMEVEGTRAIGRDGRPDAWVMLKYSFNGKAIESGGRLAEWPPTKRIPVRQEVEVRVDWNDPLRWTHRTKPAPLVYELLGAFILLSGALILAVIALLSRRRVLRIYRDGIATQAIVMDCGSSALAPQSQAVRCALDDQTEPVTVFIPNRLGTPQRGDAVCVLSLPQHPRRVLPAIAWE